MCKFQWINALVVAIPISTSAMGQSVASSACEVRNAMSAACACVWATMIFNLSPEPRQAVVETKARSILPRRGAWEEGPEMLLQLEPWERYFVGCRIVPLDGPGTPCSTEYSWVIASCGPAEDQS